MKLWLCREVVAHRRGSLAQREAHQVGRSPVIRDSKARFGARPEKCAAGDPASGCPRTDSREYRGINRVPEVIPAGVQTGFPVLQMRGTSPSRRNTSLHFVLIGGFCCAPRQPVGNTRITRIPATIQSSRCSRAGILGQMQISPFHPRHDKPLR